MNCPIRLLYNILESLFVSLFGKILSVILIFLFLFSSCKKRIERVINYSPRVVTDSTLINKDSSLRIISVGEKISYHPLVSQIYERNNIVEYILLDGNDLHIFNYYSGFLNRSISINSSIENGCGILNNYSGFYFHSSDSIFIYNYKMKMVFLIDSVSNIKNRWNILDKQLAKYPVDPEALTSSPIIYENGYLLLSGSGLGQPDDATGKNKPVSCLININTNSMEYIMGYPEQYRKGNFGGVYFNTVYHTKGDDISVLYSFPADHYVYRLNFKLLELDTIYAGSRNIKHIESSSSSPLSIYIDKDKRIAYFVGQPSYSNIIYDKYRKLYHRIASIPLIDWKKTDIGFRKPFSIITIDRNGKILSETPIFNDFKNLNLTNMHVVPDGIIIQTVNNDDEHKIYFNLYKIRS